MLKRPTVLVLGAGASCDFGFPSGAKLMEEIAVATDFREAGGEFRGSREIWDAFLHGGGKSSACQAAGRALAAALPHSLSVDDVLYTLGADPDIVAVGKLAIASIILRFERNATGLKGLQADDAATRRTTLSALRSSWVSKLAAHLAAGLRREEPSKFFENLTVINFNYDRCFEHVLFNVLSAQLQIDVKTAGQMVQSLTIHHPYGKVGPLPWEATEQPVAFGGSLEPQLLHNLSGQIKTLNDRSHDPEEVSAWRFAIENAECVAFLGFAFHEQNVSLLQSQHDEKSNADLCLTTYGASYEEAQSYISKARLIAPTYKMPVEAGAKCDAAMSHFAPTIFA